MSRCYDCQNFANLKSKATGGGVQFTHQQFLEWKSVDGNRICAYCGIDSAQLYALSVVNPRTKKRFEAVGVDRKDNALPYTTDNITPCCALCNTIKSGLLTHEEMTALGPTLRGFWDARTRP